MSAIISVYQFKSFRILVMSEIFNTTRRVYEVSEQTTLAINKASTWCFTHMCFTLMVRTVNVNSQHMVISVLSVHKAANYSETFIRSSVIHKQCNPLGVIIACLEVMYSSSIHIRFSINSKAINISHNLSHQEMICLLAREVWLEKTILQITDICTYTCIRTC